MIRFLYLILTLNNFVFNVIKYIQKKDCAMATICAPMYANTFMGKFEKLHIYYLRNFSAFYCWFIDNIFFLWNGRESELITFIHNLNQKHTKIKFKFTYSRTSTTFLDTKVYKNENETLSTTIRKPSARNQKHSQALRIKRVCSETTELIKHLKDLKDAFIKRDYQSKILDNHF